MAKLREGVQSLKRDQMQAKREADEKKLQDQYGRECDEIGAETRPSEHLRKWGAQ